MKRCVSLLALAILLPACAADPVGPADAGRVVASIQGSVAGSYEGSGQFSTGTPRAPHRPAVFTLRSAGTGSAGNQGLSLLRPGSELPAPGRYALGEGGGFSARYERIAHGVREGYTARSGELEITLSTPERIEGTFRFTGVLSCTGTRSALRCQLPAPTDGPTVEVSGSFAAVPGTDPRFGVPGT